MIYSENNPRLSGKSVNYIFTDVMPKTFGDALKEKMREKGLTAAELARRSGVTKQNIGRLVNNTPHSVTGALPKAEEATVIKLAAHLGWDLNEALPAAGFAAPSNASESDSVQLEIAEGVRISLLHADEFTEEDKQRFKIAFKSAYEIALQMIENDKQ